MSDASLTTHDVFEFSSDESDFWPSPKFEADLKAANSPFLIMLVGNGRVGKSTRANQLLTHKIKADSPFMTEDDGDPITKKFQYCGPLTFAEFQRIHGIPLQCESNPDIFVVDCEGLHSLGKTTRTLKPATFVLAQMASMTVLVMKDQVNQENIPHVRSLFVLSHAFIREVPGFEIGTVIMMRDIGVRGRNLSLDEQNKMRQAADVTQRQKIIEVLDGAELEFSEENLLVLAQPNFDPPDLYWRSVQDLLVFTADIASTRANISGASLLDLFKEAKPSIMQVQDFSNPSIPFEQILNNIIRPLFDASSDSSDKEYR
jgi:hypothetical protein